VIEEMSELDRMRSALERAEADLGAMPSREQLENDTAMAYLRGGGFHREDLPLAVNGLRRMIARAELAEINEIEDATARSAALTHRANARRI
jgi:hypothetical protein